MGVVDTFEHCSITLITALVPKSAPGLQTFDRLSQKFLRMETLESCSIALIMKDYYNSVCKPILNFRMELFTP